jgi:hypothetical protein
MKAADLAAQLVQLALWMTTETLCTFVAAQMLLLLPEAVLRLHEYAPMCMALIDPPNELAPEDAPLLTVVSAMQLKHGTLFKTMLTPLAVVAAQVLAPMQNKSVQLLKLHA